MELLKLPKWETINPMPGVYAICTAMSGNGVIRFIQRIVHCPTNRIKVTVRLLRAAAGAVKNHIVTLHSGTLSKEGLNRILSVSG